MVHNYVPGVNLVGSCICRRGKTKMRNMQSIGEAHLFQGEESKRLCTCRILENAKMIWTTKVHDGYSFHVNVQCTAHGFRLSLFH